MCLNPLAWIMLKDCDFHARRGIGTELLDSLEQEAQKKERYLLVS